jgi:predicted proteasome-type protease
MLQNEQMPMGYNLYYVSKLYMVQRPNELNLIFAQKPFIKSSTEVWLLIATGVKITLSNYGKSFQEKYDNEMHFYFNIKIILIAFDSKIIHFADVYNSCRKD